jgi:hypothetical protein
LIHSADQGFSMSQDGNRVAYEVGGTNGQLGNVFVWDATLGMKATIGPGRFPGISPSGNYLAYYDNGMGTLVIDKLDASLNITTLTTVMESGYLPPVFSPDEAFVVFLEDLNVVGSNPTYGGDLGTVKVLTMPTIQANALPYIYAQNALWKSLAFQTVALPSAQPPVTTTDISIMTGMHTQDGSMANAGGIGSLLVDDLYSMASSLTPGPYIPAAQDISPQNFGALPASGGFSALVPIPGGVNELAMQLWVPGDQSVRPGSTTQILRNVGSNTLQTSGSVPGLGEKDLSIFLANVPTMQGSCGVISPSDLWGLSGTEPRLLQSDVISAALTPDGRVLAVHSPAGSTENEVWVLQLGQLP